MPSGLDGNPNPVSSPERDTVLHAIRDRIEAQRGDEVLFVAVDGIDGGGKSTIADELASLLRNDGVRVIRSTTDSFHNERRVRWARGKLSPEGFYRDSHNIMKLRTLFLDPLRHQPPLPYRIAAFDEPRDAPVKAPQEVAQSGDVLLFDGLFLQRPELRDYWDVVIYVVEHNV